MKVICAKCSASYEIENQRIPAEGMTMKCPKCLGSFQVQRPGGAAVASSAAGEDGDDLKYFIRRHTGSIFGPFAQSAILTMGSDGKLDGSEDLSPDKVEWTSISEHPAFAHLFSAGSQGDLPAPAATQPPRLGVGGAAGPPGSQEDLPAPVGASPSTKMGMPGHTPSRGAADSDLPAPVAPGQRAEPKTGPTIKPPSPETSPLVPPPPQMGDLPTPVGSSGAEAAPRSSGPAGAAGTRPTSRPSITPPPPDMPDLPTPKARQSAASNLLDSSSIPDLPAPRTTPAASASGLDGLGASAVIPDLPTPKGGPDGGEPVAPDLPAQQPPDLPAPKGAPAPSDPGLSYGEVDLLAPAEPGPAQPGAAPLDLSELDLVAPKPDQAAHGGPPDLAELDLVAPKPDQAAHGGPPDLAELDLIAPKGAPPGKEGAQQPLSSDTAGSPQAPTGRGGDAAPKASPEKTAPVEGARRVLGLPLWLVIGAATALVLGLGGLGAHLLLRSDKGPKEKRSPGSSTQKIPAAPPAPGPRVRETRVAHSRAMDLDTHQGYLAAEKSYLKRRQQLLPAALNAARAKARLADAYRYGVRGKRLEKAKRLLAKAEGGGPELLKAKALRALLGGKLKRARKRLAKARKLLPADPEVYLFTGWVELQAGRPRRAARAFRKAIKRRGKSAAALFGLAQSLAEAPEPVPISEHRTLLARALKLSPQHVQAQVALLRASPRGEATAGLRSLEKLKKTLGGKISPGEHASLLCGRGLLRRRLGQLDSGLSLLERAVKTLPRRWDLLFELGEALLEAGQAGRAARQLHAALKLRPHSDRLLEALVRARVAQGKPLGAKDALVDFQGIERDPKSSGALPKRSLDTKKPPKKRPRGKRHKAAGGEALPAPASRGGKGPGQIFRPPGPSSAHIALARGRVALAFHRRKEAKELFLESTGKAPTFTPGHVAYLELMLDSGRLEGMRSVLEIIRRNYSGSLPAELITMEGRLLLARGKPEEAARTFRAALKVSPENNSILLRLAGCLWKRLGKPEEAYPLLQRVYDRAKSYTRAVSTLASYHWSTGERERAFGTFKAALKKNPSPTLRRSYAELLLRVPNPVRLTRAQKLLEPLLQADAADHAATALFALVELGRGHPKKAMARINRALAKRPKDLGYLVIKARVAEAADNPKKALLIYEDILSAHPGNRRVTLLRARLLCRKRITKLCLKAGRRVVKDLREPEGYLLQGLAYLQKRKPGRAMRSFKRAIAKSSRYGHAHFLLGRTQYDEAMFKKAIVSLTRCLELAEESARWWPDVHYFLGMAYFKVKSRRLAKKHLTRYLSTRGNPDNLETAEQQRSAKAALKKL